MQKLKPIFFLLIAFSSATSYCGSVGGFDAFYEAPGGIGFWGWTFIVVSALAVAAAVFFSGGATTPVWIQAVGTWIGSSVYGLSGAAATNAGLALLGGGALSAGGLGIKGGIALLTILSSTSTNIAIDYSVNEASSYFTNKQFLEDSKNMSTLPLPINDDGSDSYKKMLEWLKNEKDRIYKDCPEKFNMNDKPFQDVLHEAAIVFGCDCLETSDEDDAVKDATFLALLHFQGNNYRDAMRCARTAMEKAGKAKVDDSLSRCIYATSYLYATSSHDNQRIQRDFLEPALAKEVNNKFTPIFLAVYLDRLMYKIHGGESQPEDLMFAIRLVQNKSIKDNAVKCIPILTTRILLEIKRSQRDIEIMTLPSNLSFLRQTRGDKDIYIRLNTFNGLVEVLDALLPSIKQYEKKFEKDYKFDSSNISEQLRGFREKRDGRDGLEALAKKTSEALAPPEPKSWWQIF